MSVLESFFILFESDASDAKKEVEGLDQSLDDTEKSAQGAVKSSDAAGAAFLEMGKSALGAVAGVFALGSMVAGVTAKAQQLDSLLKFSELIGESIEDVDAWSEAVIRSGGSADSFQQSIKSLNEKVVDASVKGMNEVVPFFNQLGISIVDVNGKARSSLDLLPELAKSFEGLSKQESAGLGQKLGLDEGTIRLLQSGSDEVDKLLKRQRALGVASKESAQLSAQFNDSMADLRQTLGFTAQNLLIQVLPAINWFIDALTDVSIWMSENQTLVEGFFIGIGLAALKFAVPAFIKLGIAVWTAIAPFLAIGLAIAAVGAAFAFLYDDIVAFMNGQDSMIGQMEKRWPIVGDIVRNLVEFIKNFISAMSGMAGFLTDIFLAPEKALEKLMSVGGFILDKIGLGDSEFLANAQRSLEVVNSSPLNSQTAASIANSNATSSRTASVKTGDIVIKTAATDANGIAAEAAGSFNRQLQTTVDNFDDGLIA